MGGDYVVNIVANDHAVLVGVLVVGSFVLLALPVEMFLSRERNY